MLRFMFLLLAAITLVVANVGETRAEIIYVEDFEGEQGEPAFDPVFNHEFEGQDGHSGDWYFVGPWPGHGIVLSMGMSQDSVSFQLDPGQEVVYASVDIFGGGESHTDIYSVDFIGHDGYLRIFQTYHAEWKTIEATSDGIGPLVGIVMRSGEGFFDNLTIHVVPEPACIVTAIIGFFVCLAGMTIKTKHV